MTLFTRHGEHRQKILSIIRAAGDEGVTIRQITSKTGRNRQAVSEQVEILLRGKYVKKVANGNSEYYYRLVAAGDMRAATAGRHAIHYKHHDRNAPCPICSGDYTNTRRAAFVCDAHADWIVTICRVCEAPSFSDGLRGLCMTHNTDEVPIWRGRRS